jgi:hypothetical protein
MIQERFHKVYYNDLNQVVKEECKDRFSGMDVVTEYTYDKKGNWISMTTLGEKGSVKHIRDINYSENKMTFYIYENDILKNCSVYDKYFPIDELADNYIYDHFQCLIPDEDRNKYEFDDTGNVIKYTSNDEIIHYENVYV